MNYCSSSSSNDIKMAKNIEDLLKEMRLQCSYDVNAVINIENCLSEPFIPHDKQIYNDLMRIRYGSLIQSNSSSQNIESTLLYADEKKLTKIAKFGFSVEEKEKQLIELCSEISSDSDSDSYKLEEVKLNPNSRLTEILKKKINPVPISVEEQSLKDNFKKCELMYEDYYFIFLKNKTKAFELIAKSYPFKRSVHYMTALNREESQSISQKAEEKGSFVTYMKHCIDTYDLRNKGIKASNNKGLVSFLFEEECMDRVTMAQNFGWKVLIDSTQRPITKLSTIAGCSREYDLYKFHDHKPDFMVCTTPKLARYKTHLTCLLVKKSSVDLDS